MLPSEMTLRYLEAVDREGDNFDLQRRLKRVREEKARAKVPSATSTLALQGLNDDTEFVVVPRPTPSGPPKPSSATKVLLSAKGLHRTAYVAHSADQRDHLKNELIKVCEAWDDFQTSRDRNAVYRYLRSVYSVVRRCRSRRKIRQLVRRACDFACLPFDKAADPFTTVIRCTSENRLDHRTVSKWSRALRYAAYRKRAPRMLEAFMKAAGGINACAGRYTKVLGKGGKSSSSLLKNPRQGESVVIQFSVTNRRRLACGADL
jgi:hypothetical protein